MGVLGEMFPSRKLESEAGDAGSGQQWRLGPVDLDRGVVELVPVDAAAAERVAVERAAAERVAVDRLAPEPPPDPPDTGE